MRKNIIAIIITPINAPMLPTMIFILVCWLSVLLVAGCVVVAVDVVEVLDVSCVKADVAGKTARNNIFVGLVKFNTNSRKLYKSRESNHQINLNNYFPI